MLADSHPRQGERLDALRAYDILDTQPESDFDDFVNLAARICDMPIALVSLVSHDRQWFKAKTGLDASETPLDQSICSHAILEDGLLEIHDTRTDPRTVDNPLCVGEKPMLFYAGAPLVTAEGLPIGTLCVLDYKPRRLTDLQRDTLRLLARQVIKLLDLRQSLRDREALHREMDHRVKNSLQSVSSVVRLYARGVTDPAASEVLEAVQRRISSVGALHEALQGAEDSHSVDVADYLGRVCGLIESAAPEGVTVVHRLASVRLSARKAVGLAMIVSEFTANSIKHGFSDGRAGTVSVTLEPESEGAMRMICQDNGIGLRSDDPDPSHAEGLGRALVEAAATKIAGRLEQHIDESGSRLTLTFPV